LRKDEIQSMLDKNKSYDGYMALTSSDVDRVIEKIDEKFDVDVMVISFIQKSYPLDMYEDFYELFEREDEEDD
jgi:hypothetical protein